MFNSNKILIYGLFGLIFLFSACGNKFGDARNNPVNSQVRAKNNVEEGRGAGISGIIKGGKTTFEFSS